MRTKSLILLGLALGCGLIAALGINQVMSKPTSAPAPALETSPVYVAARDIELNDAIEPSMLKLEQWPKDKIPPGAISKADQLKDRRARQRIFAGSYLMDQMLLPKGEMAQRATDHIPPGFRVVAIETDASSTGGYLIKPGDRVDLLVHLTKNSAQRIPETVTKTFLQDIKIFAVNSAIREKGDGTTINAKTVSLLLKPDQVETVAFAQRIGRITLSLRSDKDDVMVDTGDGGTLNDLVSPGSQDLTSLLGKKDDKKEEEKKEEEPSVKNSWLATLQGLGLSRNPQPVHVEPNRWHMEIMAGDNPQDDQMFEIVENGAKPRIVRVSAEELSAPDPTAFDTGSLLSGDGGSVGEDQPEDDTEEPQEEPQDEE